MSHNLSPGYLIILPIIDQNTFEVRTGPPRWTKKPVKTRDFGLSVLYINKLSVPRLDLYYICRDLLVFNDSSLEVLLELVAITVLTCFS